MRILYLDCSMGAAGDMLCAALLELLPDREGFIERLNGAGIPGVEFAAENSVKCGITGTHVAVKVNGAQEEPGHDHEHVHEHVHEHEHEHGHGHTHHHSHRGMAEVEAVIEGLRVSGQVRENALAVYRLIAEAESAAHGVPVSEIHFHEVGTMDAIADITAVCMLMEELAPDRVFASPVRVGRGMVECAHGLLPVPAPATAHILKGVPVYGGGIEGELCTPTGAALLKHFAGGFEDMPLMTVSAVGYGMGKKDFPAANCLRAMLGETGDKTSESAWELRCNVDDMTAEEIGFAAERLMDAGAPEVYTMSIGMKKSRPGTMICVICHEADREKMIKLMFRHTSTIGIRETRLRRCIMERETVTDETPLGHVRKKVSSGYGCVRSKTEFEDLARIARERDLSIKEVRELLEGR